ncbi:MAG: lipid-A-disaccharide synthase [Bacteroidetes bacterium]|nr:lipid-A-disaccharide synthase [Bacteroidota bacterium]
MRYYLIAGEASGDMHAANLMKELKKQDTAAQFQGFGGDRMQTEGLNLVKHYKEMAFMGFWEVIKNLKTIKRNLDLAKSDIINYQPDVLILIDYPGFNMRIAPFAKKLGIKVVYYITPQVWAWKQSRVKKLKSDTDLLLPILPFEQDFFSKHGVDSTFVGHPLLDELTDSSRQSVESEKPIIALLPGSRKQEISKMLPLMMEVAEQFADYQFIIAGAPSISNAFYRSVTGESYIPIATGKTYEVLKGARAALITSGTATLEAAILQVPQVVCYKTSAISYQIGKRLVKVPFISLVNLIMNKKLVSELVQGDFNKKRLTKELDFILKKENRKSLVEEYKVLIQKLGSQGASQRAAEAIQQLF